MNAETPIHRETFVVQVISTQNASWQGTITWTQGNKQESFRSALELIRLIDSTMNQSEHSFTMEGGLIAGETDNSSPR